MGKVLKICVATNNDHKMGELKDIFKDYAVELYSLKDLNIDVNPDENGKNYAENAFIKASAVAKFTDMPVLSDDSGIEIEALGEHVPGIYSHRYAVEHGGQEITNKMLIEKCASSKAHFTAHFVLLNLTSNSRHDFEGIVKGKIADKENGTGGFGYDPIFVPEGYQVSIASLSPSEKNHISHRYRASIALLNFLKNEKYIWFLKLFLFKKEEIIN